MMYIIINLFIESKGSIVGILKWSEQINKTWIHIISEPLDSVSGFTPVFRIWRCPWNEHIILNWPWKNDTTFRSWESKENHWDPLRLVWVEATVPCPVSFVVTRVVEAIATNRRITWLCANRIFPKVFIIYFQFSGIQFQSGKRFQGLGYWLLRNQRANFYFQHVMILTF